MNTQEIKAQKWQVDFYNQWKDLFGKSNWYDFTLLHVGGEYAHYSDSIEVCVGLLGFNVTITYRRSLDFVEGLGSLKDEIIARLEDEHPGIEIKDPMNVLDQLEKDND